jgi:hypothetical protein
MSSGKYPCWRNFIEGKKILDLTVTYLNTSIKCIYKSVIAYFDGGSAYPGKAMRLKTRLGLASGVLVP